MPMYVYWFINNNIGILHSITIVKVNGEDILRVCEYSYT